MFEIINAVIFVYKTICCKLMFSIPIKLFCFDFQEMDNVLTDFELNFAEGHFPGWPVSIQCV